MSSYIHAETYDMWMDSENVKKEGEDLFCEYPPELSALKKKDIKKQWTGFCSERHTTGPLTQKVRLSYSKYNHFKVVHSDPFYIGVH